MLKVVQNIRRAHMRLNIQTVSLAPCVRATEGLLKEFLLEHGPLALIPKRKEPLTNEEIFSIFSYSGPIGRARSQRRLDWGSPEYSSLLAMFHTLAQTGMRKGEVSLARNARFDKSRISMRNVRWSVGGVVYDELTPELYARLCTEGGYALLRPPPSKADPFSLHWGPCTIYLRFHPTETINAARELAREELRRKMPRSPSARWRPFSSRLTRQRLASRRTRQSLRRHRRCGVWPRACQAGVHALVARLPGLRPSR